MAQQQQQQQQQQQPPPLYSTPSAAGYYYKNEWPAYPELKRGYELCPDPQRRPFAPFRNCRAPVPPPRRKTAAELAHEARERAWVDRQIYITNLPGRRPSILGSDPDSESEAEQAQDEQQQPHLGVAMASLSSAPNAAVRRSPAFLSNALSFILNDGLDAVAALVNGFYHLVIILAFFLLLASALREPAEYFFKMLLLLFMENGEPEVVCYVLVQNYRSWSVAQPC